MLLDYTLRNHLNPLFYLISHATEVDFMLLSSIESYQLLRIQILHDRILIKPSNLMGIQVSPLFGTFWITNPARPGSLTFSRLHVWGDLTDFLLPLTIQNYLSNNVLLSSPLLH